MTTIVTCFYKLQQSKHLIINYDLWINNFLLNISNGLSLLIFTGSKEKKYIEDIVSKNITITYKIIELNIEELPISKQYGDTFWKNQYDMDNQKHCGRGVDCYKLWNSKCDFLKIAIENNYFNTNYFVWNDIGNVRNDITKKHLTTYKPCDKNVSSTKIDIVLLNPVIDTNTKFFKDCVHFSGSIFGGHKNTLLKFHDLFYEKFKEYVINNQFIGCDQQIITSIYLRNDILNPIFPNNTIDKWFYLYKHYKNLE